jgi:N-acetylmuramoyl-L-alanine amidase CwlA
MVIKQNYITTNKYSRSGKRLKSVKKIVLHWVANPETTAKQNRNYFEQRKKGKDGYGAAHYICDKSTNIQCIPDDEVAYHVGAKEYTEYGLKISSYPNARTIGIEFCHPDWSGKPDYCTYKHIVELCKYLCVKYGLNPILDITTHNAITGKDCPKYYINNTDEFHKLKKEVKESI